MKSSLYKQIIEKYREIQKRSCAPELATYFPDVPLETLESIVFQEYQRKTKRTFYKHTNQLPEYYQRYLKRAETVYRDVGYLLQIADEVDFSPALMAKYILEHHYKNGLASQKDKDSFTKTKLAEMLKDTSLISCQDLAAEIRMCILSDKCYGFISDTIRKFLKNFFSFAFQCSLVGLEYEMKLKEDLTTMGFTFIDEKQLRERGYDKTPDVKLDIPIVVDGHIVNWIESKASFGDEERHREYLRDQYWSYCNRFGPGLVIYWSGYIEELNNNKDDGIIISDKIPTEVTYMNPSLLMKKTYMDKIL